MLYLLFFSIIHFIFSAQEMASDEIRSLSNSSSQLRPIHVSAYVSDKSEWSKDEIEQRLLRANQVLKSCNLEIQQVYFHRWTPSQKKLRVDELITPQSPYYDGMSEAARKSLKVTPVDLFYFDSYLNPFASLIFPFAVYPDPSIPEHIHNTAWFPYYSEQRKNNGISPTYSEEAHELGHILLQSGHDHSGQKNIMASDSKKRSAFFSQEQCQQMMIPEKFLGQSKCSQQASKLYGIFATHFKTYHMNYYMNDWCSRNSYNLAKKILDLKALNIHDFSIVYTSINSGQIKLSPQASRYHVQGWRFHVFILTHDGLVLDLDFKKQPTVYNLKNYLDEMWGPSQLSKMKFQVRKADDPADITFYEYKNSLAAQTYPILSSDELLKTSDNSCEELTLQLNY